MTKSFHLPLCPFSLGLSPLRLFFFISLLALHQQLLRATMMHGAGGTGVKSSFCKLLTLFFCLFCFAFPGDKTGLRPALWGSILVESRARSRFSLKGGRGKGGDKRRFCKIFFVILVLFFLERVGLSLSEKKNSTF